MKNLSYLKWIPVFTGMTQGLDPVSEHGMTIRGYWIPVFTGMTQILDSGSEAGMTMRRWDSYSTRFRIKFRMTMRRDPETSSG